MADVCRRRFSLYYGRLTCTGETEQLVFTAVSLRKTTMAPATGKYFANRPYNIDLLDLTGLASEWTLERCDIHLPASFGTQNELY